MENFKDEKIDVKLLPLFSNNLNEQLSACLR